MTDEWVVVLEAAGSEADRLELSAFESLLGHLGSSACSGLFAPDRYAVVFFTGDVVPEYALSTAVQQWRRASVEAGLPLWQLVRAEIKTVPEHEAEHLAAEPPLPLSALTADRRAAQAAYQATRAILRVSSRKQALRVMSSLVYALGGWIVPVDSEDPCAIPIDLPLTHAAGLRPAAEPLSVARLQLEEILPLIIEDAEWAVAAARRGRVRRQRRQEYGGLRARLHGGWLKPS